MILGLEIRSQSWYYLRSWSWAVPAPAGWKLAAHSPTWVSAVPELGPTIRELNGASPRALFMSENLCAHSFLRAQCAAVPGSTGGSLIPGSHVPAMSENHMYNQAAHTIFKGPSAQVLQDQETFPQSQGPHCWNVSNILLCSSLGAVGQDSQPVGLQGVPGVPMTWYPGPVDEQLDTLKTAGFRFKRTSADHCHSTRVGELSTKSHNMPSNASDQHFEESSFNDNKRNN